VVSKTLSRKLSIVESDFGVQREDTQQKTQDENLHIERIRIQNIRYTTSIFNLIIGGKGSVYITIAYRQRKSIS
jgi:CHAD domain-containing protein